MYNIEPHISLSPVADDAMQEEATSLAPGDVIAGQFEVLAKLGSGGMSSVYRCFDLFVERVVAVKILFAGHSTNPRALNRFRREARAIAKLDHPNIVRLHSFNFDLSTPYIVMEIVDGTTLAQLIASNGPLAVPQVLCLAEQLCSALHYAHTNGVIHRDLKPSNIIIERFDGEGLQAKVLDFGIAKMLDDTTPGATATGELFGTPAYMSPEQALGKSVDRRTDQYSLGCVLFECLTGAPPFVGSGQLSVLMQHVQSETPSLEECTFDGRTFPPQIQPALDKMLAKFPEERYDSMSEAYQYLTETQSESEYVVETFSKLINKADSSVRVTQPNLAAVRVSKSNMAAMRVSQPNLAAMRVSHSDLAAVRITNPDSEVPQPSTLPFWAGLAVGFSAVFAIICATTAIYFFASSQAPPPVEKAHISEPEHFLGGIDVKKAFVTGVQLQVRQDRQRKILYVEDKSCSDRDLAALQGANSIEDLNLGFCENVTDNGVAYAWHLPLIHLSLKGTAVTNNVCRGIAEHFPGLESLCLQQTSIGDEGLSQLTTLKHLVSIDLKMTDICKPCVMLSKLPSLRMALFDGSAVDLRNLNNPELTRISANGAVVDDAVVAALMRHKKLASVSLNNTNLNDEQLMKLAGMKSLRELSIQDCSSVTANGLKRFRSINNRCKVVNVEIREFQKQKIFEQ